MILVDKNRVTFYEEKEGFGEWQRLYSTGSRRVYTFKENAMTTKKKLNPKSTAAKRIAIQKQEVDGPLGLKKNREQLVAEHLGHMGAMLSGSKSDYLHRHPTDKVFFNANLYDSEAVKLWFGDFNVSRDGKRLQALADSLGETLYVTTEMPYRFQGMFGDTKPVSVNQLVADAMGIYAKVVVFHPVKP